MSSRLRHPQSTPTKSTGLHVGEIAPGVAKVDPIIIADNVVAPLRRPHGRRRRPPRDPAQRDHRAHRPERRRQDHAVQPADRLRQAEHRQLDVRRQVALGRPGLQGRPARPGAHLPAHQGARPAHRAREHEARRARASAARASVRACSRALWRKQETEIEAKAIELLARFKLDTKEDDFAASLSGGQRKLLEMARALMSDPTLVMLDEPMAGVNPALTQSLLDHILGPEGPGHDGAVRRARHADGAPHRRLGRRHGRGHGRRRRAARRAS